MNKQNGARPLIGVVVNPTKAGAEALYAHVSSGLTERGMPCRRFSQAEAIRAQAEQLQCLMVIGGDGSILRFSDVASACGIPLLGVNVGRIGFLAELTQEDLPNALDRLQSGDYAIDSRMVLRCQVNEDETYHCVNDIVVYKRSFSGVTQIRVGVDDADVGTVFCDGMIAATPTGSTAYSLSAGGPVIARGIDAIVLTPICSHTLHVRPIVASAESVIRFSVLDAGVIAVDGMRVREVGPADRITVTRSARAVQFIRMKETDLFRLIREKLS